MHFPELGLGSETDVKPKSSNFDTILNHLLELVVIMKGDIRAQTAEARREGDKKASLENARTT